MEVQRVVISGVISPLIWVISIVTLLITLLNTTHEPPSIAPAASLGLEDVLETYERADAHYCAPLRHTTWGVIIPETTKIIVRVVPIDFILGLTIRNYRKIW